MSSWHRLIEGEITRDDLIRLLKTTEPGEIRVIQRAAETLLLQRSGAGVYFRGLVEASNACACDCFYCGIRKSNRKVRRFTLSEAEIMDCAFLAAKSCYGSLVIQSAERADENFLDLMARCIERIKRETRSAEQPDGLGITLSLGQLPRAVYQRFFNAGAHRYLLRIETTNPELFAKLHPSAQTFSSRVESLAALREVGYQVGTGVMIGLPGQSAEDLADDALFFKKYDIDMIGMGPFIPHPDTPLRGADILSKTDRILLSLKMIAAVRLCLKDVNIAATTALQTLDPLGREKGLKFGANVMMPQITPASVRRDYQLYPGKPYMDENAIEFRSCLATRIAMAGRFIGYNRWGDSRHARTRGRGREEGVKGAER